MCGVVAGLVYCTAQGLENSGQSEDKRLHANTGIICVCCVTSHDLFVMAECCLSDYLFNKVAVLLPLIVNVSLC